MKKTHGKKNQIQASWSRDTSGGLARMETSRDLYDFFSSEGSTL